MVIHEHDASLLDDALGKKVVLCSPTTLFAVLGVVRQAMDTFAVERKTDEILDALADSARVEEGLEQVDKVEKHLGTLSNSVRDLTGARRNQLEKHRQDRHHPFTVRRQRSVMGASPQATVAMVPYRSRRLLSTTLFLRDVTDRSAS